MVLYKIKRALRNLLPAVQGRERHRFGVHISYPHKSVSLDAVPYVPALSTERYGSFSRLKNLGDAGVFAGVCIYRGSFKNLAYGENTLNIYSGLLRKINSYESKTCVTEGHIRIILKICFNVSKRVIIARTALAKLGAGLAYGLAEPYTDFADAAHCKRQYSYASAYFPAVIKYNIRLTVKLRKISLHKSYLKRPFAKQLFCTDNISFCLYNSARKKVFFFCL